MSWRAVLNWAQKSCCIFIVFKMLEHYKNMFRVWRRWWTDPYCPLLCQTNHGNLRMNSQLRVCRIWNVWTVKIYSMCQEDTWLLLLDLSRQKKFSVQFSDLCKCTSSVVWKYSISSMTAVLLYAKWVDTSILMVYLLQWSVFIQYS